MILSERGLPVPPSDVLAALARVSPRLGLAWSPAEKCWRFSKAWGADDPRMAHVRAGHIPEVDAYDWMGPLPPDCSLDEALPWFEKSCREITDPREIDAIANRAAEWNKTATTEAAVMVDAESTERLVATSNQRTGHFDFDRATNEAREEEYSPRD